MKLLFCKGHDFLSQLIKFVTKSEYTHCGFYFEDTQMVYESVMTYGVHSIPVSSYANFDGEVLLADIEPQPNESILIQKINWSMNDKYSWTEILVLFIRLMFKIPISYSVTRRQYICSELISEKLDECGIKIFPWPELVTPGDVANSPLIKKWTKLY